MFMFIFFLCTKLNLEIHKCKKNIPKQTKSHFYVNTLQFARKANHFRCAESKASQRALSRNFGETDVTFITT